MYFLTKPCERRIRQFIDRQKKLPFTYREVGASREQPPADYVVDHNRICLGTGKDVFVAAQKAITQWQMFALGWVELCWPNAPIEEGTVVAVLANVGPIWSLNACRIVYVLEEQTPLRRFGFAYGTLPQHAERGEERFIVEWHADDSVWYDLKAFSKPQQFVTQLGYPFVRMLQKKFATDSKQAMKLATTRSDFTKAV